MEAARSGSPGLDLDVLQLFAALMETGALHRAATRLDISQPMASRELNRMRAIFNDKLFIKAGAGMVPTARGRAAACDCRRAGENGGDRHAGPVRSGGLEVSVPDRRRR